MSFRLTSADLQKRNELAERMSKMHALMVAMVVSANEEVAGIVSELRAAVRAYNKARAEAAQWVEGKAAEFRDELDERSEAWLETEAGQQATNFVSDWEDFEPDAISDPVLPDLELDGKNTHKDADRLLALPAERSDA